MVEFGTRQPLINTMNDYHQVAIIEKYETMSIKTAFGKINQMVRRQSSTPSDH